MFSNQGIAYALSRAANARSVDEQKHWEAIARAAGWVPSIDEQAHRERVARLARG